MKGAKEINADNGPFSDFIRNYTKQQYELRFGETPSHEQVQQASDAIATAVIDDILNLNPDHPNPTHTFPTLEALGKYDAEKAAAVLFKGDTAGWSGNLLLLALGDNRPFQDNLLHLCTTDQDTYDFLAAMKIAIDCSKNLTELPTVIYGLLEALIDNTQGLVETSTLIESAYQQSLFFLRENYGDHFHLPYTYLPLPSIDTSKIILGSIQDDILSSPFTNTYTLMHGGLGNDTLMISRNQQALLFDGGKGFDTVDFSQASAFGMTISVVNPTPEEAFNGEDNRYYNIECYIGTPSYDTFLISSFDTALTLNGYLGEDRLIIEGTEQAIVADLMKGTMQIGALIYHLIEIEGIQSSQNHDYLIGDSHQNTLSGGQGNDTLEGHGGLDRLYGNAGNDCLFGNEAMDSLHGGDGQDSLYGGLDNDNLYGNEGNDLLYGNAGHDVIDGGEGDDTLIGGIGEDWLWGGKGKDIFIIQEMESNDIRDFETGIDLLYLSSDLFYLGKIYNVHTGRFDTPLSQLQGMTDRIYFSPTRVEEHHLFVDLKLSDIVLV